MQEWARVCREDGDGKVRKYLCTDDGIVSPGTLPNEQDCALVNAGIDLSQSNHSGRYGSIYSLNLEVLVHLVRAFSRMALHALL